MHAVLLRIVLVLGYLLTWLVGLPVLGWFGLKIAPYKSSPPAKIAYTTPFPRNDTACSIEGVTAIQKWARAWHRHLYRNDLAGMDFEDLAQAGPDDVYTDMYEEPLYMLEIYPEQLFLDRKPVQMEELARFAREDIEELIVKRDRRRKLLREHALGERVRVYLAVGEEVPLARVARVLASLGGAELARTKFFALFELTPPKGLEPIPETLVRELQKDYVLPSPWSLWENPREVGAYIHNNFLKEQAFYAALYCPTLAFNEWWPMNKYERLTDTPRIATREYYRFRAQRLSSTIPSGWLSCGCNADIEFFLAKYLADLRPGRVLKPLKVKEMTMKPKARKAKEGMALDLGETWGQAARGFLARKASRFCFEGRSAPRELRCR